MNFGIGSIIIMSTGERRSKHMISKDMPCKHVRDSTVQPWELRTERTCLLCGKIFRDMEHYVIKLTKDNPFIREVLDVGTGLKGPVAEHYWTSIKNIQRGYVCDIWKLKPLPSLWVPLNMDALKLLDVLERDSVDVVQAFGFLEHLEKKDGLKFLEIAEEIAIDLVIVSAAICIHSATKPDGCGDDPDYKVKIDGNPYHRYNSAWQWDEFEELGFTSNWEDAKKGDSFKLEAIAWKIL